MTRINLVSSDSPPRSAHSLLRLGDTKVFNQKCRTWRDPVASVNAVVQLGSHLPFEVYF